MAEIKGEIKHSSLGRKDNTIEKIAVNIEKLEFTEPQMKELCLGFLRYLVDRLPDEYVFSSVSTYKNNMLPILQQHYFREINSKVLERLLLAAKNMKAVMLFLRFLAEYGGSIGHLSVDILKLNSLIDENSRKKTLLRYIKDIDIIDRYHKFFESSNSGYSAGATTVVYIDTDLPDIIEVLIECYLERKNNRALCLPFMNNFSRAIKDEKVNNIDDLTFKIMMKQAKFVENLCQKYKVDKYFYIAFIKDFYLRIQMKFIPDFFEKEHIPLCVVYRFRFMKEMLRGFVPLYRNPYEPIPDADKWLLIYDNNHEVNSQITTSQSMEFDFTVITNKFFRNKIKAYTWIVNKSVGMKQSELAALKDFFAFVDDIASGKVITLYAQTKHPNRISEGMVIAYKNFLNDKYGYDNNTYMNKLYGLKAFISFLDAASTEILEGNIIFHLSNLPKIRRNTSKAIDDEELKILSAVINSSQISIEENLCAIVFYLAITTEIRSSQIVRLQIDSVRETCKNGEYVIVSKMKVTGIEEVSQPISIATKRSLDNAINLTKDYRYKCDKILRNYIFVLPDTRFNENKERFKLLTQDAVNIFLKKCCRLAGLNNIYNLSNLRDTHINLAKEHVLRNNLSDVEQMILNGHNNTFTDNEFYIDEKRELTRALEATNHIIIGDVSIEGSIIEDITMNNSDIVEYGCGYCSSSACNMNSFLGCLMCKFFVTMPSRISYFHDYIKVINERIASQNVRHDKEDLVNIKRLLSAYLEKLYIRKDSEDEVEQY